LFYFLQKALNTVTWGGWSSGLWRTVDGQLLQLRRSLRIFLVESAMSQNQYFLAKLTSGRMGKKFYQQDYHPHRKSLSFGLLFYFYGTLLWHILFF
jgi:hypothetical protein